jgi:hypothetical protein
MRMWVVYIVFVAARMKKQDSTFLFKDLSIGTCSEFGPNWVIKNGGGARPQLIA